MTINRLKRLKRTSPNGRDQATAKKAGERQRHTPDDNLTIMYSNGHAVGYKTALNEVARLGKQPHPPRHRCRVCNAVRSALKPATRALVGVTSPAVNPQLIRERRLHETVVRQLQHERDTLKQQVASMAAEAADQAAAAGKEVEGVSAQLRRCKRKNEQLMDSLLARHNRIKERNGRRPS